MGRMMTVLHGLTAQTTTWDHQHIHKQTIQLDGDEKPIMNTGRQSDSYDINIQVYAASCYHGSCTYHRYAVFSHLPDVLIMASSVPLRAAVVAAPIQKLWPL